MNGFKNKENLYLAMRHFDFKPGYLLEKVLLFDAVPMETAFANVPVAKLSRLIQSNRAERSVVCSKLKYSVSSSCYVVRHGISCFKIARRLTASVVGIGKRLLLDSLRTSTFSSFDRVDS